jgi:hypothetical protein
MIGGDSGVVHQDIEVLIALDRLVDEARCLRGIRHIRLHRESTERPAFFELCDQRLGGLLAVRIVHYHLGSRGTQFQGDRSTDTARCARHDRHCTIEPTMSRRW